MRYAQYKGGLKLHLVCEPGEEYRGEVVRIGNLSWPLCGLKLAERTPQYPFYRMTINVPLGQACQRCQKVAGRQGR